jgi:hypothetical protein
MQEVDDPDLAVSGFGLRSPDSEAAVAEVGVLEVQGAALRRARAGEAERRDDRPPRAWVEVD